MQKAFPTLSGASQTKRSAGKGSVPSAAFTSAVSDARDALLVLGYSQADVNEALSFCDTSAGTDEIIKAAACISDFQLTADCKEGHIWTISILKTE